MSTAAAVVEFRDPAQARGFTQLDNVVLFDTRLPPGARCVYAALKHFAWKGEGEVPPQPELAVALGVSERSLRTHLKELVDVGLITMRRRRSKPNLYVIENPVPANIAGTDQANLAASNRQILPEPTIKTFKTKPSLSNESSGAAAEPKKPPPHVVIVDGKRRDLLYEALELEMKRTPATKSERGRWNRALGELREAGVSPEQLSALCRNYRKEWPTVELTPTGLAANLSKFLEGSSATGETQADRIRRIMEEKGIA